MQAVQSETLDKINVEFSDGAAACVVLASAGYPEAYKKGFPITLPETEENESVFVAGAVLSEDGKALLTNGGRVLGATATADTLENAIAAAYRLSDRIHFENAYCRRDIGRRALLAKKEN